MRRSPTRRSQNDMDAVWTSIPRGWAVGVVARFVAAALATTADRRQGPLILALGLVTRAVVILSTSAPVPPAYAKKHPPNSLRVLLVRHGSAEQDSLTRRGIEEARATGKALKQREIVAVIASPAGRTKQTAAIIVQELGRPAVVAEDDAFMVKQGESVEHATVRALGALRALTERYGGGTVVIVTHFDVCAALLRQAAGNAQAAPCPRHELGAPSITEITVLPGGLLTLALSSPSSPVAR